MPIYKGTTKIKDLFVGATKISRVYYGSTLVYTSSLLPSGYIQCEYLESTGTQYIEPNITPSDTMGVYVKYNPLNHTDYVCVGALYPAGGSIGNVRYYVPYWFDSSNVAYGWNTFNKIALSKSGNAIYEAYLNYFNDRKAVFDGTVLSNSLPTLYNHNSKLILFGYRNESGTPVKRALRVYNIQITDNDTLQHNFIPCLDNTGTPCMYDTVSKQTFYNQGTGQFLFKIKAQIPENYTLCDYIESTGTQWLETNIAIGTSDKVTVDFAYTDLTTSTHKSVVSATDSGNSSRFHVTNSVANNPRAIVLGEGGGYNNSNLATLNQKYSVTLYSNGTAPILNGASISTNGGSWSTYTSGLSLQVFKSRVSDVGIGYYRAYQLVIFRDKLLMNLIPCLDENLKPCMYDSVSKQTFYNQGTGEFIYKTSNYKIPDNYTLCEYLESTGTQYIDTNYYATNTSGINIDYAYTKSGNAGLCGIFQSQTPRTDTLFITTLSGQTSTVMYLISQGEELTNNVVPQIGTKYNGKINYLNNGKLILNNTTTGNNGSNGVVSSRTIKLFCRDNGGSLAYTNARIYECILTTGNTIARYLVPCLDDNGVPCMYDLVNKQTYYNAGTGQFQFAIGGELPSGYKHIKWIQGPTTTDSINSPPHPRIEIPFDFDNTMTLRWVESSPGQSNNLAIYNGTTRISYINPWTSAGKFGFYYNGAVTKSQDPVPVADKVYDLRLTPNGGYVDGVQITDSNVVTYPTGTTILNCIHSNSTAYYTSRSKNYLIQITAQDGTLLLNAIPVLDDNNVPCLYDTVSKTTISKTPSDANNFLYEA